jgi:hypothetical protein
MSCVIKPRYLHQELKISSCTVTLKAIVNFTWTCQKLDMFFRGHSRDGQIEMYFVTISSFHSQHTFQLRHLLFFLFRHIIANHLQIIVTVLEHHL